jgi:hypothetical protein
LASELASVWKAQNDAIVTAQCQTRLYRYYVTSPKSRVSRKQVLEALGDIQRRPIEEAIRSLQRILPDFDPLPDYVYWGIPILIEQLGSKVRNTYSPHTEKMALWRHVELFDGQDEIQYTPEANRATVYPGHVTNLVDIYTLTRWPLGADSLPAGSLTIGKKTADGLEVHVGPSMSLQVSDKARFIERIVFRMPGQGGRSLVLREALRVAPREYPGGIVFPTVTVQLNYTEAEDLRGLSIHRIDDAHFNLDLPAETFVVGVPPQTRVQDARKDRSRPPVLVTKSGASDVKLFADTWAPEPASESQPTQTHRSRTVLTGVLGATLSILGVFFLFRRASRNRARGV